LQGDSKGKAKGNGKQRVLHLVAQASAQPVAIGTLHPGPNHAGCPEQEGDSAGQVQKDQRTIHGKIPSGWRWTFVIKLTQQMKKKYVPANQFSKRYGLVRN
jgi:hypothetical protein